MNSKGITPLDDHICLVCQKEKATHTYLIYGRGYGSSFDGMDTEFRCCDKCDKPEFKKWFGEEIQYCCPEDYRYEEQICNLFDSLPINSRERIFNVGGYEMEPQDWIDYELDELPHEKCKEYGRYSPDEIKAYNDRFPKCSEVYKTVYSDGSSSCRCDCGAFGNSDGSCGDNIADECYMCTSFGPRASEMGVVYETKEEFSREKDRLLEMYRYSVEHLNGMGIDIKNINS